MEKTAGVNSTNQQYDQAVRSCKDIFIMKTRDYGTSWRVLRTISIADQLYIKARRIRTLQQTDQQKIGEDKAGEFEAMVNYGVIGLIQLSLGADAPEDLPPAEAERQYTAKIQQARSTMLDKNHDYGEAWREMRISSLTDLILMKLLRVKQIEDNQGLTLASEGIKANYQDILNYSVFALIKLGVK